MKLEFGYGKGVQEVLLDEKNLMGVLLSNEIKHEHRDEEAVRFALEHPIGKDRLSTYDLTGKKIAIVTSDISRPLPSYRILPALDDRKPYPVDW